MNRFLQCTLLIAVIGFFIPSFLSAQGLPFDGAKYEIKNLGKQINSAGQEYGEFISPNNNRLFYGSNHGPKTKVDIYYSDRVNGEWGQGSRDEISSTVDDEGTFASANVPSEVPGAVKIVFGARGWPGSFGSSDLYSADLVVESGELKNVKNLGPSVNAQEFDSHPAVSKNGDTLYFVSLREEGDGLTDIWMSVKQSDGFWGEAQNLGDEINTSDNERSPFLSPDGSILYFASDGHGGFGGYDIFYCMKQPDGKWGKPQNLGDLVNTQYNEQFFYYKTPDDFLFASDRPDAVASGYYDLYQGKKVRPPLPPQKYTLNVGLADAITNEPITGSLKLNYGEPEPIIINTTPAVPTTAHIFAAGQSVGLNGEAKGYIQNSLLSPGKPDGAKETVILKLIPKTITFDLGKYNIPFYVTGYYQPNVRTSLLALAKEQQNDNSALAKLKYIDPVADQGSPLFNQYQDYAVQVEQIFDKIRGDCNDLVFTKLVQEYPKDKSVIYIDVWGYADERNITGNYIGEPFTFLDTLGHEFPVNAGEPMNNKLLSGARARYTAKYIDEIFSQNQSYVKLKQDGRIRYRTYGMGILTGSEIMDARRKVLVRLHSEEPTS